jgi:transposase
MKITTIGIDLAKNVFQIHGVDERGKVLLKKQLKRDQMIPFFANLPPYLARWWRIVCWLSRVSTTHWVKIYR